MKQMLVFFFVLFAIVRCKTPERIMVEEPSEEEVNYTIKKILNHAVFKSTSNLLKASRNGLLDILPESYDSIMMQMEHSEIEESRYTNEINTKIANAVEMLQSDFTHTINKYDIDQGFLMILNQDKSITKGYAQHYYQTIENKFAQYLQTEMNANPEIQSNWEEAVINYNQADSQHDVDPELFTYLGRNVLDHLFDKFSEREMILRNNISLLQDATATKVFNYYIERYIYGDYKWQ